jgi:formamidopyrimidine-DNA glycosylase
MPELPDIEVYREALEARLVGQTVGRIRLKSPFVLRTVAPALEAAEGRTVLGVRRLGKRVVLALSGELFVVIHLMVAGRLRWQDGVRKPLGRIELLRLEFPNGSLILTEAGTKRRASVHLVQGEAALAALDPGGIDVSSADLATFDARLRAGNRTLKRALTDPRAFSGIGNAYSDEILHRARLSPLALTGRLDDRQVARLHEAARAVLAEWVTRLRREAADAFPTKVTAFRPGMAVHGRYRQPCPDCGAPVQRIVYAENECNYCARCQTGGRVLADRALSRLLHEDWPRHIDELE